MMPFEKDFCKVMLIREVQKFQTGSKGALLSRQNLVMTFFRSITASVCMFPVVSKINGKKSMSLMMDFDSYNLIFV